MKITEWQSGQLNTYTPDISNNTGGFYSPTPRLYWEYSQIFKTLQKAIKMAAVRISEGFSFQRASAAMEKPHFLGSKICTVQSRGSRAR